MNTTCSVSPRKTGAWTRPDGSSTAPPLAPRVCPRASPCTLHPFPVGASLLPQQPDSCHRRPRRFRARPHTGRVQPAVRPSPTAAPPAASSRRGLVWGRGTVLVLQLTPRWCAAGWPARVAASRTKSTVGTTTSTIATVRWFVHATNPCHHRPRSAQQACWSLRCASPFYCLQGRMRQYPPYSYHKGARRGSAA